MLSCVSLKRNKSEFVEIVLRLRKKSGFIWGRACGSTRVVGRSTEAAGTPAEIHHLWDTKDASMDCRWVNIASHRNGSQPHFGECVAECLHQSRMCEWAHNHRLRTSWSIAECLPLISRVSNSFSAIKIGSFLRRLPTPVTAICLAWNWGGFWVILWQPLNIINIHISRN